MVWGKAGSTTLASTGDTLTTSTFTPSTFNMFMVHVLKTGGNARGFGRVGNSTIDTGSNYAYRRSPNGGSDSTFTSQSVLYTPDVEDTSTELHVGYYVNISAEEKLFIMHIAQDGGSGAGNDPDRAEEASKWTNTSNQINIQQVYNTAGGDFASDSNLSVLGSDITPAAAISFPTNVQVGSRAEITDTRKMYNYSDTSKSKLKAYYHFEDNGTNAQTTGDGLGSSADMTLTGATYVTGKVGSKAISFDGTNDYTTIGSSTSQFNFMHNTTHEWTVSFWFKSSDMSSMGMIFTTMKDTSSQYYGVAIRRNNSSTMAVNFGAGTNQNRLQDTKAGFSTDGNWHHIVITAKASDSTNSLEYWQDGVSLGTTSNSGKVFSDTDASFAPYIGQASSDQYLDGALDELSIWNRRLTDAEIATLYNSGTGQVIADGMSKSWQEIGA